jgi:V8-like Glu-specific endopeptidase
MPRSFAPPPRRAVAAALFAILCTSSAATADEALDAAVLKKTKAATVRLKVTLPDNTTVQGSGFIISPTLVITNAHVLGMLRDESRKPKKVEVLVKGGTDEEKTYAGQVLGVDSGSDLGVIRVAVKGLPEPVPLAAGNVEVLETQTVFIFGYPFGDGLGKNVTVTKSTVTGTRKTPAGYPQTQLGGGLHPGNSGGPVLNAKGEVVGVAVSGLKGTQIHFAVPVSYVHGMLLGRTHRWFYGTPYLFEGKVRMPISTMTYDPLNAVRMIRVEVWTGDPGPDRTGKTTDTKPGDSPLVKTELAYKNGSGSGEIELPELPAGKTYWIQLVTVRAKSESATPGRMLRIQQPVERTPVVLAFKPQAWDPGRLTLSSDAELKVRDKDGDDHSLVIRYQTDVVRRTDGKAKPDGTTTARLDFSNAKQTFTFDGQEDKASERMQQLLAQVNQVQVTATAAKDGELLGFSPALAKVPQRDRRVMEYLVLQMAQGLDSTVVPLPGKEVTHDKPWTVKRDVMVSVLGSTELAVADLTFTYLGVRKVGGRTEAVVKGEGTIRGRKGEGQNLAGKMEVTSFVDVESGQIAAATARIDVDLDLTEDGGSGSASGVYSVRLRPAAKAPPKP